MDYPFTLLVNYLPNAKGPKTNCIGSKDSEKLHLFLKYSTVGNNKDTLFPQEL